MKEYEVSDYGIFNDAVNTASTLQEKLETSKTDIETCGTKLQNGSIFMGPICDSCTEGLSKATSNIEILTDNYTAIKNYLIETADTYQKGDKDAEKVIEGITGSDPISLNISNQSTDKKNIDTSNVKSGSNVANALQKYQNELDNAEYATVSENLFTTTTTDYINGQPVKVTHIVINNGNQINGAPANGTYGNGLERSSSAANRLNSSILINGSHFDYGSGKEDLKGANNIVIVDGQIKRDGVSGGNELLLDNYGNIFNAYGKSAQELVNNGVKYSFACHSTQVIENGNTSPSYREGKSYKRNVIGQTAPGEYYIITDTNYSNRLCDTAEYLKSKGVKNAYSLDQGGSVSLVRDKSLINNPSDESGERAVGDFLYFTT